MNLDAKQLLFVLIKLISARGSDIVKCKKKTKKSVISQQ